jgi:hypothetical protein
MDSMEFDNFLDIYIKSLPLKSKTPMVLGDKSFTAGDLKKTPFFRIFFQAYIEGRFDQLTSQTTRR